MGPGNAIAYSLYDVATMILELYKWVIIISAILSWVNADPYNPIVRFLRAVTEPVFYRIRRWMPIVIVGGFDLSPILVLVAIFFVQSLLFRLVNAV